VQRFREWRAEHGRLPDAPLTADDACSWLAELADRGAHKASTLSTYAAALSNWYDTQQRHPDSQRGNPMGCNAVRRLLAGVANVQAERQQQRALAELGSERCFPLTLPTLRLYPFDASSPRARMYRAAAYLGVCLALRISELLGSPAHPARAIRMEQLSFFSDTAALSALSSAAALCSATPSPVVLQLVLRATKTRHHAPTVKVCAVAEAVQAVWQWYRECCASRRAPSDRVFQLDSRPPVSSYALMRYLRRRHAAAGLGAVALTGKSLRSGGASTLAALGVDEQHIAQLGWADDSPVWHRYASHPGVQRQRAIQRSRLMAADVAAPPVPAVGSSCTPSHLRARHRRK
jgi:integrase